MAHKFINEINPGEVVDDIYMVKEPILRSTTRGDFRHFENPLFTILNDATWIRSQFFQLLFKTRSQVHAHLLGPLFGI